MVHVLTFDAADAERYADIISAAAAAATSGDRERALDELTPIAGDLWMGQLKRVSKTVRRDAAADRRRNDDVLRARVFLRDGYRCTSCGGRVIPRHVLVAMSDLFSDALPYNVNYKGGATHPVYWALAPEADHVIAHSRGGTYELGNLTTLHAACNTQKSDADVADLPAQDHVQQRTDWDGLTSLYGALIAAGAGTVRPRYHAKWARIHSLISVGGPPRR